MYAVDTAKMSSQGQMVIPDSFRKRYGWMPGSTLLLIATGDSLVVQSLPQPDGNTVGKAVSEAKAAVSSLEDRLRSARASLAAVKRLGIRNHWRKGVGGGQDLRNAGFRGCDGCRSRRVCRMRGNCHAQWRAFFRLPRPRRIAERLPVDGLIGRRQASRKQAALKCRV